MINDDEDGQCKSLVTDCLSKVLDDDGLGYGETSLSNSYYQNNKDLAGLSRYKNLSNGIDVPYTGKSSLNCPGELEFNEVYIRLNDLNLGNTTVQQAQLASNEQQHIPRGQLTNGLLTTSSSSGYHQPNTNGCWPESVAPQHDYKDMFSYQRPPTRNCDVNYNVGLNLSLDAQTAAANDLVGYNTELQNTQMINVHDYNIPIGNQAYRPNSAMTNLSADSGLSNSPAFQHFSPPDSLQSFLAGNYPVHRNQK